MKMKEFQLELPNTKIIIVDGRTFCWPGCRFYKSINVLLNLINE